jgi:hypothetical protein
MFIAWIGCAATNGSESRAIGQALRELNVSWQRRSHSSLVR